MADFEPDDTIRQDPRATLSPLRAGSAHSAIQVLTRLAGESATRIEAELEIEGTLGEGGMGIVRLAKQVALGRKVAVKALRPEHHSEEATLRLLTEAWVTGSLEHPNIVPVYNIGLDASGHPLIVLKRIEGESWAALMADAAQVQRRFGTRDLLEWNLRVLMQVCTAVHFAHSRGIIHRDLKPENVMLGEFREVYVLDWGIAVSMIDDGSGRIPLAAQATDLAGTPSYMAPEMISEGKIALSPRTDVYLLGAILYEILAGDAPHDGRNLAEIWTSVRLSHPKIPDTAPAELTRICRRAMDPDPDARFENAEQVRLALQGYLQRRDAGRIADAADVRLGKLLADLAAPASTGPSGPAGSDGAAAARRLRLYTLFSECRFGYREALHAWPSNEHARAGLGRAVIAMAEYELVQGDPRAAATLLGELEDAPAELTARVASARERKDREHQRITALAADMDHRVGQRTRAFSALVLGLLWTVTPLASRVLGPEWETHTTLLVIPAIFLILILGIAVWARESLMKTAINRRMGAAVAFMTVAMMLLEALASRTGVSPVTAQAYQFFLWFVLDVMLVIMLEWRLFPSAIGYLAACFLTADHLAYRYYIMSVANFVLTVNAVWVWFPKEPWVPRAKRPK